MSTAFNIVEIPDAKMKTAMLALPGGAKIELLEYTAPAGRRHTDRECVMLAVFMLPWISQEPGS